MTDGGGNPLDDVEDMGFLAEDACRQLCAALSSNNNIRLLVALRCFMREAKKGKTNG